MADNLSELPISELPKALDHIFYANLDPFFHFVTLETLGNGALPDVAFETLFGGKSEEHDIVKKLRKSNEKRFDYIQSLGRIFRYFSSETLILMLISGEPFGPFAKISSLVRNDKLNEVFSSVADSKVPEDFSLFSNAIPLSFEEWISHRVTGRKEWLQESGNTEIVQLIIEEADLLKDRGAINAFKHGKPFAFGKSIQMHATLPETGKTPINVQLEGINWIDWKEPREGSISIGFNTQEIIPEQDKKRIFSVALLINAICQTRLALIEGVAKIEIHMPSNFKTGMKVRRQNITLKFNPREV